jgi:hypothetical protein
MAKLETYIGPHAGTLKIYFGIFQIGSGKFSAFSDFQTDFAGSYNALGKSGTFTIAINLTDQDPASTSGPCKVTLNGKSDNAATYQVSGQKLALTTALNDAVLDVYVSQGGTQVDNISGHNIWIG